MTYFVHTHTLILFYPFPLLMIFCFPDGPFVLSWFCFLSLFAFCFCCPSEFWSACLQELGWGLFPGVPAYIPSTPFLGYIVIAIAWMALQLLETGDVMPGLRGHWSTEEQPLSPSRGVSSCLPASLCQSVIIKYPGLFTETEWHVLYHLTTQWWSILLWLWRFSRAG